jgi:hypothetical protein
MITHAERITAVEVRLLAVEKTVEGMDKKLDDLLALRYKGQGAFWLAAMLLGTGIVGAISQLIHYLRS